jgi:hypothetical protein
MGPVDLLACSQEIATGLRSEFVSEARLWRLLSFQISYLLRVLEHLYSKELLVHDQPSNFSTTLVCCSQLFL